MQHYAAPVADPENPGRQINGKAPAPGARRALGDIGNLGNGLGQLPGGQNGDKPRGVLTRRKAAELLEKERPANAQQANDSWGTRPRASLRPRDSGMPVVAPAAAAPAPPAASVLSRLASSSASSALGYRASSGLPDIDSADKGNPLAAADFVQDIFAYYKRTEAAMGVSSDYMSRQADINDKMRAILLDWLVDVHLKFKLVPETLFLTANLIDRFLEAKQVTRKHLQLVGVTAMLVASKYEEIWAPEVRDFVYISDRAYTRDQILNMEKIMLNVLRFNLTVPTPHHFLLRFLKAAGCAAADDPEAAAYATYLAELALPDYTMLRYKPSMVAAAAVYCARTALRRADALPLALARHSGYAEPQLRECAAALAALAAKAPDASLTAVFKKYSHEKQLGVAATEAPASLIDGAAAMDA